MSGSASTAGGIDSLMSLLQLFHGKTTTTSGGTETSGKVIDSATLQGLLKSALESNSGLASIVSGQQGAGMYNSTTNSMLTNDLLSRLTVNTAAAAAPTVTSKTPTVITGNKVQGVDVLSLIGSSLAKKGYDKVTGGKSLLDLFSGAPATADLAALAPGGQSFVAGSVGDTLLGSAPEMSSIAFDALAPAAVGIGSDMAGSVFGATATESAIDSGILGGVGAGVADAAGIGLGATATEVAIDGGILGGAAAAGEGLGLGEILSAAIAWVVCTELNKQGKLPYRLYIHGAREFAKYDEQGKKGYYIWAIPAVKHLRKHPNSLYSKLLKFVFNARAEYLAARTGQKGCRKTLFGAVTVYGLYGFCWLLSRTIAKNYSTPWNSLYPKEEV